MTKICFLCGISYKAGNEVTLHCLPSDIIMRNKWLDALEWTDELDGGRKHYFVCSRHFTQDSFAEPLSSNSRRLKPGAIPCILNPNIPPYLEQIFIKEECELVKCEPMSPQRCEPMPLPRCEPVSLPRCEPMSLPRCEPMSIPRCEPVPLLRCEPTSPQNKIREAIFENPNSPSGPSSSTVFNSPNGEDYNMNISDSEISILSSPNTDSEDTLTASSPSQPSSPTIIEKKNGINKFRYVGDFALSHLQHPSLRRRFYKVAIRTVMELRTKNKMLQQQVRRLKGQLKKPTTKYHKCDHNFKISAGLKAALQANVSGPTEDEL